MLFRLCLMGTLGLLVACSPVTLPAVATRPSPAHELAGPRPAAPAVRQTAPAAASSPPVAPFVAVAQPTRVAPTPAPVPRPMPTVAHTPVSAPARPGKAETVIASVPVRVQISGRVDLVAAPGQQLAPGEQVDTLVYFVPQTGATRPKPGRFTVYTNDRDFSPAALAIPLGSTVNFVNLDEVRHNVFSVTPGSAFDLGFQGNGDKAAHVFAHAGPVLVSCNVHRMMQADLWVVPSPYVGRVAADGSFRLRDVPAGPGTLQFWNPRARPVSQPVRAPMAELRQRLLAIKPRVPTELNLGQRP